MGPKPSDRVVILGAGPAGVHMASLLTHRGFERVTVLERSDRVGGKSLTVSHGGLPHEMGTCYLHPGYKEIDALVAQYGLPAEIKPGGREGKRDIYFEALTGDRHRALDLGDWMLALIERDTLPEWLWWMPDSAQKVAMLVAVKRYSRIHQEIFGTYAYTLPGEPDDEGLARIDMTFLRFLEENDLTALVPLFMLSHSAQGYGLLDTVPALYGLWWNTPELLEGFLVSGSDPDKPVLTMLPTGFQPLWQAMAKKDGLDIWFDTQIDVVRRPGGKQPHLVMGRRNGRPFEIQCDFLVVTSNLPQAMATFLDARPEEHELFAGMRTRQLMTTLFEASPRPGAACIVYWPDVLRPGMDGRLYCTRDTRRCLAPETVDETQRSVHVAYQYVDEPGSIAEADLVRMLDEDLAAAGYQGVERLESHAWPYFTRFTQDAIRRRAPWRLFNAQGFQRTWYAGASACFESVHDVVNYNLKLVAEYL
jgi:hypothetical protein